MRLLPDGGRTAASGMAKRILSRELAEQMHTNQLPKGVDWIQFGDEKRTGVGFGLGFSVTVEPGEKAPHNHKGEFGWGRGGEYSLLGVAARSAGRCDDGAALAVFAGDGRDA